MVLLDEPDADLDQQGEQALVEAIGRLREEGVTLIVIAHRSSLISGLDKLLVINAGQVARFDSMQEFTRAAAGSNVRVLR